MESVLASDAALAVALNALVRTSAAGRALVVGSATGLARAEVALMGVLVVVGKRRSAVRMLAAVGLVYLGSEVLGSVWRRERPFARLSEVEALVPHSAQRSFPSRHVASGLAMAAIGRRAHPLLGVTMSTLAWLLGFSRIGAGLHYPTDVLAGAALGSLVGGALRERE